MFHSILIVLGGGNTSRRALCEAVDIARAAHAKVVALFVVEHHLLISDVVRGFGEEKIFSSFVHEQAEQELRRADELFADFGLEGYTVMIDASGEPVSDVICRAISSAKIDLVAMGRHDQTVLEKIFGSVADELLSRTDVPVVSDAVDDQNTGDRTTWPSAMR